MKGDTYHPHVTRVEVVDATGRSFVQYYSPGVEVQLQDDGRTLKVLAGVPDVIEDDAEPEDTIPFVAIANSELPYANMDPTDLIEWVLAGRPKDWKP
jgi:hypothetical protein